MEFTRETKKDTKRETKKLNKAVAIKYDPGMAAPSVVAKGTGFVAEKIIEKAKETDVKLFKNEDLVEELSKIELGSNIPPELYEVVAQVLIFVSDLDKLQGFRNNYERR